MANVDQSVEKIANLGNSIEILENNAERVKCEVNEKIDSLIESINTQRRQILNEIDSELNDARKPLKKYDNMTAARMEAKKRLAKDLEGDDVLISKLSFNIDEELNKTSVEMPTIMIQWNLNFNRICEEKIGQLKVYKQSRFERCNKPLWSTLNRGKADDEVSEAGTIAIDSETSNIYVGDASAGKILIMNNMGEYLRTLKFKKPSSITRMMISHNDLYCNSHSAMGRTLYRIEKDSGKVLGKFHTNNDHTFTITPEASEVFLCNVMLNLNILSLDLRTNNVVPLKSPYLRKLLSAVSSSVLEMKCVKEELVMLIQNPKVYPIQVFDKGGTFLRGIAEDIPIGVELLYLYPFLCVDEQWNIYISHDGYHLVNVYNKHGRKIASVGTPGNDRNEMFQPKGIALNKDGNLIVCNNKKQYILQAY